MQEHSTSLKSSLFLTRNLEHLRHELRAHTQGESRCGLIASSGALRLRAEGLEPGSSFHAEYPWHHWYLAPATDIRSSYQCEVFATEFEVQGLELDWVGLCWGGDFIRSRDEWSARDLRYGPVTKWSPVKRPSRINYRTNAYRVLLTRSRQGMIIFVPQGSSEDPTRLPQEFDQTAAFLLECGVRELSRPHAEHTSEIGFKKDQPHYAR